MIKVQQRPVLMATNLGLTLLLAVALSLSALAVVDGHLYPFEREQQAQRFKALAQKLRCPTCQNQNIADSNSPIAKNLRQELYAKVLSGQSEQEILAFMVARYGDFVLYQPPVTTSTYFLWFGPLLVLLAMLLVWFWVVWRPSRTKRESAAALSVQQQQRAEALLVELAGQQPDDQDPANSERPKP